MPRNDDKDNKRTNYSSKNDNKKPIQGNKDNQYDLIDINVKKAQQDIKKIFDTAKTELDKFHRSQENMMKKTVDTTQKQYENMFSNITKKYNQSLGNMSSRNALDALGGSSSSVRTGETNTFTQKDKLKQQLSELTKSNEENGKLGTLNNKWGSDLVNKLGEQINKNYSQGLDSLVDKIDSRAIRSNKILTNEFSKLTDTQVKSMGNLDKLSGFLKAGEITFNSVKAVFDNWTKRFFSGMEKIVSTYENTYQKVAVITDTNQHNYRDWQNNTVKLLRQQGLDNNVTISQMMEELSTVTSKGVIDIQKATELSLQNSITKSIAPYLDTTTDAYQDLQLKFGNKFVTQMNGIVKSVGDSAGSVRYISQNMNDIITQLEPIAQNATNEQFSQQFAEAASMIDSAVARGDMTLAQANELKNMTMEAMDPIKAIKSDNLAVREFAATASEEDFKDISKVTEEVGKNLAKWGDVSDDQNPFARGALGEAIGVDTMSFTWNPLQSGEWAKAIKSGNNTGDVEAAGKELQENFKNDQYTTSKQQKENYAENISTSVATFKEQYPDAYDMLKTISTSVVSIAGMYIGGKLLGGIGNLLGVGSGSGGLLGKLGGSGGLFSKFLGKGSAIATSTAEGAAASSAASSTLVGFTTVAGGIALGALASKAIAGAIQNAQQETYEKNVESAKSKLKGTKLEGNAAAESAVAIGDTTGNENNSFFNKWGAGISSTVTGIGSVWNKAFGDVSDLNKNEFQLFKDKLIMVQGDGDDKQAYAYAWYLLADSAGRLSDISESVGSISRNDLKEYVNSDEFNKGLMDTVANNIVNDWNKGPYKSKKERQPSIDWSLYGIDGSHATGLDYVPEDGYVAQLHQGEAILTSTAADVIRSIGASSMGATGITSAIGNLFNIVATPIKEILGASSRDTGNGGSSKEIVDAIYYQTSVLESAIKNINNASSNGNADSSGNKANRLTMRTNYNKNLVNLVPSMR